MGQQAHPQAEVELWAEGEIPLGSNPYKEGAGTSCTKTGGAIPQVSRVALPIRLCASQKQGETDFRYSGGSPEPYQTGSRVVWVRQ